ncbi:MAG: class I tRNA ligase family protein, partial [Chlamydiae bacterium]|nr:class I tRNA ligase family protein [Chlamydiota bacterium]
PEIDYVKLSYEGESYILAKEAVPRWFKGDVEIEATFKGSDLIGKSYKPLFPYFADQEAFVVIGADFVSTEDGTGIVHTAPGFGEDDFYACKQAGLPLVCPVDINGLYTKEVPDWEGRFVKDCDKEIAKRLKGEDKLFFQGTIRHRYPFCWRSDTPLIYKAVSSWFFKVEELKPRLLEEAEKMHWTPGHLKAGRFGKWLEGARDWAISRNRHFGTPIPLWRSESGKIHVVGSIEELEQLTGQKIEDLHRHFIDDLTFEIEGETYRRIPEVFDCWFDTGCVPFAHMHYPFENRDQLKVPCDFVAEGIDQTRCWFYTTTILAVALFDQPAFRNVIANGILLAENGQKMSKRLQNYPEPDIVLEKYGADAVRLYMLHSPAVKADDLRFAERGVELVLRQILIPFWNAHAFFLTYARIYKWKPEQLPSKPVAVIDRWILARLNALIETVERGMDDYDLSRAVEPFVGFVDELTNWYIRRSRRRFWADEDSLDRREAFETLHYVLLQLSKIAAPFVPFLSEAIFQNLKGGESVHLESFPQVEESLMDEQLERGMDAVQTAVSLGHSLRKSEKIKVRQPLPVVHVVVGEPSLMSFMKSEEHLIAEELNVKEVQFHEEKQRFVKLSIKPNFPVLGKKVGKHMREAQAMIQNLEQDQINSLVDGHDLEIVLGGESFTLTSEDVQITRAVHEGVVAMNAGVITIALETELSEELILEGIARELVNRVNTMRREANFSVTDRITLKLGVTDKVRAALLVHGDYLKEEVLATSLEYGCEPDSEKLDINGEPTAIFISRKPSKGDTE